LSYHHAAKLIQSSLNFTAIFYFVLWVFRRRSVAEHPVLIFLQVRAGRVKLIEFLRSGSRSTCGLWHTLGGTRERELLLLPLQGE
jgi:hypothetical protein